MADRYQRDSRYRYTEEESAGSGQKTAFQKRVDAGKGVVEDFLNKAVGKDAKFSWGLVVLLAVALFAVVQIVRVFVYFWPK